MPDPIPSATTVLMRTCRNTFEVLLLRRNSKIAYGGFWVFPGGRIDQEDYDQAAGDGLQAAHYAALRETREESGIILSLQDLTFFAHWTTPVQRPKRFSTWFFATQTESIDVVVDGGEIRDFKWLSPVQALGAHRRGEIELSPPTFVTLTQLAGYASSTGFLKMCADREPEYFAPRIILVEGGLCCLYEGDVGYELENPDLDGPRHRLWARRNGEWSYEKDI